MWEDIIMLLVLAIACGHVWVPYSAVTVADVYGLLTLYQAVLC